MIWVGLLMIALGLAGLASDRDTRRAALICAGGLIVMQFWPLLPGDLAWLASAATWVAAGVAILRAFPYSAGLLILSGLCYFWARFGGYEFGGHHAPALFADLFGIAALITIGWRVYGQRIGMGGGGRVAGRHRRGRRGAFLGLGRNQGGQEKEVTP